MSYLKKLAGRNRRSEQTVGDEFGWWIGEPNDGSFVRKCRSDTSSSASLKPCIDLDEYDTYDSAPEQSDKLAQSLDEDNMELCSLMPCIDYEDIDLEHVEKGADDSTNSMDDRTNYADRDRAHCYTPERLIRCQDYRILTPSPRFASLSECIAIANILWARNRLRNTTNGIVPMDRGASHLEALLDSSIRNSQVPATFSHTKEENKLQNKKNFRAQWQKQVADSETLTLKSSIIEDSTCEREMCSLEENCTNNNVKRDGHELSASCELNQTCQDDSNSSCENIKSCFSDDVSSLSGQLLNYVSKRENTNVNEIITEVKSGSNFAEGAVCFDDEDRFCETNSNHNLLTRLALTIETDGSIPDVIDDPDNVIHQLRIKVEKLQHANKDIYKDIDSLQEDFRNDVWKVKYLSTMTKKLHEDINEMRYLDDLLSLLEGKLEKISRRDWPFVLRRSGYETEEMNLVV